MKKYFKFLVTLIIFSLIFGLMTVGCSKNETCIITEKNGVKYCSNRNVPANPNLKLVIDNKIEIVGNAEDSLMSFSSASDMEIDEDGNFYILDGRLQTIYKYDKTGKYILQFCRSGNGPGEINGAKDIAIVGDSITICSPEKARVSIFDKNGNFGYQRKIKIPAIYYGVVDIGIGENEILGFHPTFDFDDKGVTVGNNFVLKDKKYETKILLLEMPPIYEPTDIEGSKILEMNFAYYDGNIYYPTNFPSSYTINVKDRKGKLKSVISKHARRIEFNPEEEQHYTENGSYDWNGVKIIPNCKMKSVMNNIFTDKLGHLLVWVSQKWDEGVKHNPSIDVFKDGEFQNTIILDQFKIVESHNPTDMKFDFKEDKLIVYDISESVFSIYDYHYEGM